jgi:hypothetical protein
MAKRKRRREGPANANERRMLRQLSRALERLEQLEDPAAIPPVDGEPTWVKQLAPSGRAFARLLLIEADRPSRR